LGGSSPFNVSYQHCCKKNINVNDSQNLAFATAHLLELLPLICCFFLLCWQISQIEHRGKTLNFTIFSAIKMHIIVEISPFRGCRNISVKT
jgi:hypothetical protein